MILEFNEVQTDKRNTYRKKVAADKASGKTGSPQPGDGEEGDPLGEHDTEGQVNRDGQPAAKKARREPSEGMPEYSEDEVDDDEAHGDETEDDEGDNEQEERPEAEEQLEEIEQREIEDEALDNGEDSD
jgi:DNA polymerase epsilon subunit 3